MGHVDSFTLAYHNTVEELEELRQSVESEMSVLRMYLRGIDEKIQKLEDEEPDEGSRRGGALMTAYVIQRLLNRRYARQYRRGNSGPVWTRDITDARHFHSVESAERVADLRQEIVVAVESEVQP